MNRSERTALVREVFRRRRLCQSTADLRTWMQSNAILRPLLSDFHYLFEWLETVSPTELQELADLPAEKFLERLTTLDHPTSANTVVSIPLRLNAFDQAVVFAVLGSWDSKAVHRFLISELLDRIK